MRKRTTTGLLALAAVLGAALPARAQASFSVYVSIGDSLAAGFSSGSLVETHQRNSVPALIARQAALADFQQPTVSEPGLPTELGLLSLTPPIVVPKATSSGEPTNLKLPRPYNNLAVPGAKLNDALTKSSDGGGFHDLILRKLAPQIAQAAALKPTFVTVWIGNNDVLGAALSGRAIEGVTLTAIEKFRLDYVKLIGALKSTGAQIVAANIPDVTAIPFVTTIPPVVVNPATRQPVLVGGVPVPLIGPSGTLLDSSARVLLSASPLLSKGVGIPKVLGGQGTPLPDEVVLDGNEQRVVQDYVNGYNQAIANVCAAASVPVVDVNGILNDIRDNGRQVGGIHLSTDYLTGGVFSYDGVHPTELGYAILANEWIAVINAQGGDLPPVDLTPFLGIAQSQSRMRGTPELSREAVENLMAALRPLGN